MSLNESIVEKATLEWLLLRQGFGGQVGDLGYAAIPVEPATCAGHADRRATIKRYLQVRFERSLKP